MERSVQKVPFGHVESESYSGKGTLVYYDMFQDVSDLELERSVEQAKTREFAKLVLYPLHEETIRRMWKRMIDPYYKREDRLFEWRRGREDEGKIAIENWEGKRKKYTPIEAALRYLAEKYPQPLFLYLTPETANAFASFSSFEEWIGKVRLILNEPPKEPHPRLAEYRHRWDVVLENS